MTGRIVIFITIWIVFIKTFNNFKLQLILQNIYLHNK